MRRIAALICLSMLVTGCQSVRGVVEGDQPNPGPCPTALSLYDAHRVVNFHGDGVVYSNVGFTGEILNVVSFCEYTDRDASPISMDMGIRMAFGRGPAASGRSHTYQYFVAVTRRDQAVIERQVYPVTVEFPAGVDRVELVQEFENMVIPRADASTSGANFEVIVGFELTEEQLEFNRSGQRFRVTAGSGS
ncbi:hypothetical protein GCM10011367_12300 [Marinicauda pacifica]|jgi:hypothetical protein|uniref:Uncharacterized protein n=1 Tax=Marinicauda pacifica TaxID=1133559 RepID=A0A4S2HGX3_9PROT|nr:MULTISPECIES: hypothetical protein [Marinicauda]TGY94852.1 hypothetical protein E5162_06220 [Marinicauda pacifica]GGE39378.1 hypothetical protein GCM10011367_12300 [Marinicauda pacifica]